jgi:hypothetical protein
VKQIVLREVAHIIVPGLGEIVPGASREGAPGARAPERVLPSPPVKVAFPVPRWAPSAKAAKPVVVAEVAAIDTPLGRMLPTIEPEGYRKPPPRAVPLAVPAPTPGPATSVGLRSGADILVTAVPANLTVPGRVDITQFSVVYMDSGSYT